MHALRLDENFTTLLLMDLSYEPNLTTNYIALPLHHRMKPYDCDFDK